MAEAILELCLRECGTEALEELVSRLRNIEYLDISLNSTHYSTRKAELSVMLPNLTLAERWDGIYQFLSSICIERNLTCHMSMRT
jgi:hypothetical protein